MWFTCNSRPDEYNIKHQEKNFENPTGTNNRSVIMYTYHFSQQCKPKLGSGTFDELWPQLYDKDCHLHKS